MENVYSIIVTYNAMPWIERCLNSIGKQSNVILIDNNSTDDTVNFVNTNFPNINLYPQKKNLGFGKANNIGITEALKLGATHVFLVNQDVYLDDNTIYKLVSFSKGNPQYGIISPIHYNGKGTALDTQFAKYLTRTNVNLKHFLEEETEESVQDVPFVNAAAWLITKACIVDVGGFDPLFFHYGEDENYCQRVLFHSFKIGVLNTAFIRHDREDRPEIKKDLFTQKYYTAFKKVLSVKYADINSEFSRKAYKKEYKKTIRDIIKSLIRFNLAGVRGFGKQLRLVKKTENKILKSRALNSTKGAHYIL
ncbi:glycosyltransferase family 2 protein [Flavivirga aquimarina]|uniref:Glycosyltransferase family 2 protein n=1 Tax=Flavivirga aquimarina TaxID=2027862 RepID=A0ABT8WBN9_9FLAO|nr:glycosyltransferase family 2 protein [Flavivirga aquimarina]MDO5970564.1 glycosyltransferase family 2 protein [Flavivirga aquimarina]